MRTARDSRIMAALMVLAILVVIFRVGYNVGSPEVDWLGYPVPHEHKQPAPDRGACDDDSADCNGPRARENACSWKGAPSCRAGSNTRSTNTRSIGA